MRMLLVLAVAMLLPLAAWGDGWVSATDPVQPGGRANYFHLNADSTGNGAVHGVKGCQALSVSYEAATGGDATLQECDAGPTNCVDVVAFTADTGSTAYPISRDFIRVVRVAAPSSGTAVLFTACSDSASTGGGGGSGSHSGQVIEVAGVEYEDDETDPTCAVGNYNHYADADVAVEEIMACVNGVAKVPAYLGDLTATTPLMERALAVTNPLGASAPACSGAQVDRYVVTYNDKPYFCIGSGNPGTFVAWVPDIVRFGVDNDNPVAGECMTASGQAGDRNGFWNATCSSYKARHTFYGPGSLRGCSLDIGNAFTGAGATDNVDVQLVAFDNHADTTPTVVQAWNLDFDSGDMAAGNVVHTAITHTWTTAVHHLAFEWEAETADITPGIEFRVECRVSTSNDTY